MGPGGRNDGETQLAARPKAYVGRVSHHALSYPLLKPNPTRANLCHPFNDRCLICTRMATTTLLLAWYEDPTGSSFPLNQCTRSGRSVPVNGRGAELGVRELDSTSPESAECSARASNYCTLTTYRTSLGHDLEVRADQEPQIQSSIESP